MSRPRTLAEPEVGVVRLSRHLMNVLLPAPFGPSRPIVPGGTCTVTLVSAGWAPYIFPSRSVSMMNERSERAGTDGEKDSAAGGFNRAEVLGEGWLEALHRTCVAGYN